MPETSVNLIGSDVPAGTVGSALKRKPVEAEEEYVYGRHIFVLEKAGERGKWLDRNEETALDVVGCIGDANHETFHAIINPRHASILPEDEPLPGIRRIVSYRSEIDEAREKIQAAGLRIVEERGG